MSRTKKNTARKYLDKKYFQLVSEAPESEEFLYLIRKCGGSSHIQLGKRWLGRFVKVKIEEVKEE